MLPPVPLRRTLTYLSKTPGVSGRGAGRIQGTGPAVSPGVVILKHTEMGARAAGEVCNEWCTLYIIMRNGSISCTFSPLYHPTGISAHVCVVLFLQAWAPCIGTMNLRSAPFMSLTLPTDWAKLSALWVWLGTAMKDVRPSFGLVSLNGPASLSALGCSRRKSTVLAPPSPFKNR